MTASWHATATASDACTDEKGQTVGTVELGQDGFWYAKARGRSLGPFSSNNGARRAVELNLTITPHSRKAML